MTEIPGICAKHKIITPECLKLHSLDGAYVLALNDIEKEFFACANTENLEAGAKFHLVLTVER